jgi:hypothetical protein
MKFNVFPSPLGRRCRGAADEAMPYLNRIAVSPEFSTGPRDSTAQLKVPG